MIQNIFYKTIKHLQNILLPEHKRKAVFIFVMVFVSGMLEVFGLAVILPVISIALDTTVIKSNETLAFAFHALNFETENAFLFFLLSILIVVFLLKNAFGVLIAYSQSNYSYRIATDVAKQQFMRYYQKDLQFFNENNSSKLYQNIRSSSYWLSTFILIPMISFFSELVVVAIIICGMAYYDLKIFTMVTVTLVPVFLLIYRFIKNKVQRLEVSKANLDIEANKSLYQTLNGYVDVKLFNKDKYFIDEFLNFQEQLNFTQSKTLVLQSLPTKVIEITAIIGVIVIIVYSKLTVAAGSTLIPLLSLYIIAAYRLMPSMNRMLISMMNIKSYQYLFDILTIPANEHKKEEKQNLAKIIFEKNIELKDISFAYPDAETNTLEHISLKISKGERIGFIGHSGSGKTTLINILLRFLKENNGSIVIDGETVLKEENINSWRDLIGYVKQNVFIIDGDFYENIAFGVSRDKIDHKKMERVIKSSMLKEVVDRLPEGLRTNIGENGTKLSGGQRQRIAIARALYKDAQILIFDEATSALDQETEKEITSAIDGLSSENKTMFIIAHRLTTLKNCDRIVELEHGKVKRITNYDAIQNPV